MSRDNVTPCRDHLLAPRYITQCQYILFLQEVYAFINKNYSLLQLIANNRNSKGRGGAFVCGLHHACCNTLLESSLYSATVQASVQVFILRNKKITTPSI